MRTVQDVDVSCSAGPVSHVQSARFGTWHGIARIAAKTDPKRGRAPLVEASTVAFGATTARTAA